MLGLKAVAAGAGKGQGAGEEASVSAQSTSAAQYKDWNSLGRGLKRSHTSVKIVVLGLKEKVWTTLKKRLTSGSLARDASMVLLTKGQVWPLEAQTSTRVRECYAV